jgi:hypothetical protein
MVRSSLFVPLCMLVACRLHFDEGDDVGSDAASARLRIEVTGWGAVTGPGGIACTETCEYTPDGPVALTATAGEAWVFDRFESCGAQPTCSGSPGETIRVTFARAPITANRVFVTSGNVTLSPTGRTGLDMQCQSAAAAGGLTGTFLALVSTTTEDARDRLTGSRGWVRLDGLAVLDLPTDIGLATMPRGVLYDELLGTQSREFVLTGSTIDGRKTTPNCNDWSSSTANTQGGRSDGTGAYFFGSSNGTCAGRVFCFETGRSVQVSLKPPPFPIGRYVFLSMWTPSAGIASADARCAGDAAAAGLPGTYKALLATTTQSVLERVGTLEGVWRRPDGGLVTRLGLDHPNLETSFAMSAAGAPSALINASFGAASLTTRATLPLSCDDWTNPAGLMSVLEGWRASPFDLIISASCGSYGVVCVQTQ